MANYLFQPAKSNAMQKYENRREAGMVLAAALRGYQDQHDVIVLALPRGGVPVAYEVAISLHVPLDIYLVRKLGVPGHHELAMGAIAQGDVTVFNQNIVRQLQVTQEEMDAVIASEKIELLRRETVYRGHRTLPSLRDKIVILIDDGVATGATLKDAIQSIRQQQPRRVIAAVPVADMQIQFSFQSLVDEFVCPLVVDNLQAVGIWYNDFSQTEDAEVHELLTLAQQK
jgi:putative phosphoribosyl transferase